MSHVKAGGTSKNNHDSPGQRLGVKAGDVIVRQVGMNKRAGKGTFLSRNYTIHAAQDGVVKFVDRKIKTFSGASKPRTEVTVE
jgi:large subunit ribosomal protein L27